MQKPEAAHFDPTEYHVPVMPAEVLAYLDPKPGESVLDATLGGGGHSALISEKLCPGGTLVALDRDPEAVAQGTKRLAPLEDQVQIILISTPFGKLESALTSKTETQTQKFDGMLFDLGVSSHQLDTKRGFSFRRDEPLDMRMNAEDGISASELIAQVSETEIARILWEYGEERFSRPISRQIVKRREEGNPITTTGQLADLVSRVIPRATQSRDLHPATRSFQALRIAVNAELDQLKAGLQAAIERLKPGGRIVVLSYHSLEDRIVKQFFAEEAGKTPNPSGLSLAILAEPQKIARLTLLTRKPVLPTEAEVGTNPRARSAKLRAARRNE